MFFMGVQCVGSCYYNVAKNILFASNFLLGDGPLNCWAYYSLPLAAFGNGRLTMYLSMYIQRLVTGVRARAGLSLELAPGGLEIAASTRAKAGLFRLGAIPPPISQLR